VQSGAEPLGELGERLVGNVGHALKAEPTKLVHHIRRQP
jgi:hypothetical protein